MQLDHGQHNPNSTKSKQTTQIDRKKREMFKKEIKIAKKTQLVTKKRHKWPGSNTINNNKRSFYIIQWGLQRVTRSVFVNFMAAGWRRLAADSNLHRKWIIAPPHGHVIALCATHVQHASAQNINKQLFHLNCRNSSPGGCRWRGNTNSPCCDCVACSTIPPWNRDLKRRAAPHVSYTDGGSRVTW